jgi:glycosyltransferase involved in cell wall biosynthesis
MRIGMMVDTYKPYISGVTNHVSLNKVYMEKAGHQVFIFTFGDLDYEDEESRVIRSPGVPVTDTGYYLNFRYSKKAKLLLQTMDIVHVHHPFISGRLALRYCRPLQIPIAFTNHTRYDLYAQAYLPMLPEEISESLLHTYIPPFCEAVDLVISPSAGMANVLRQLGVKSHIEILPNGVEMQRFFHAKPLPRERFGLRDEDILLVYAGRLGPEKNIPFLIQTFSGVAEALKNVHLMILGKGPEEERLKKLAAQTNVSQRIHFTGMIPYEDIPHYLAMCDIFVTASVTEVHPLSVIEAMGAGLPTLGLHSVGVGDTVEDGKTGFLASENQAAFAAQMTRLCLDAATRKKMGHAAREISSKYAIERTTRSLLNIYEKLVFESVPKRRNWRVRLYNHLIGRFSL